MLLLLKLTITPVLVALVSLAARRWGPTVAGLIMGFPWMTGPILFFLGMEHGDAFVARAAVGVLIGTVAIGANVLAFATVAKRASWPFAVISAFVAFAVTGYVLSRLDLSLWPAAIAAVASLLAAYWLMPSASMTAPPQLPWWDIPMRMLATAALVGLITVMVDFIGPELVGVVSTYPVIVSVVSAFTHGRWGWQPAVLLARGVTLALLSFVAFFLVLGLVVESVGLIGSFAIASAAALVVSAILVTFNRIRATHRSTGSAKAES